MHGDAVSREPSPGDIHHIVILSRCDIYLQGHVPENVSILAVSSCANSLCDPHEAPTNEARKRLLYERDFESPGSAKKSTIGMVAMSDGSWESNASSAPNSSAWQMAEPQDQHQWAVLMVHCGHCSAIRSTYASLRMGLHARGMIIGSRAAPEGEEPMHNNTLAVDSNFDDRDKPHVRRMLVAEALGSSIYVLLSLSAYTLVPQTRVITSVQPAVWLSIALAHGLAFFVAGIVIYRASPVHISPAVTLALVAVGHFPRRHLWSQLLAQLAGGMVGAVLILVIFGETLLRHAAVTAPPAGSPAGWLRACLAEGVAAAIFLMALVSVRSVPAIRPPLGLLAAALTLTVLSLAFGPMTGAVINPIRALTVDITQAMVGAPVNWFTLIVVYLTMPLVGAVVGAVVLAKLMDLHPGRAY